jgi:hypothetical protein
VSPEAPTFKTGERIIAAPVAVIPARALGRPGVSVATGTVARLRFRAKALAPTPEGEPLEELAERIHLIVVSATREGQKLGYEAVEPWGALGQEHIARLELGRMCLEPGALVTFGPIADGPQLAFAPEILCQRNPGVLSSIRTVLSP